MTEPRKLGIDIDGCLASFNTSYIELLKNVTGRDLFGSKDYSPTAWNYDVEVGYTKEEISKVWNIIKESNNFWELLLPIEGAQETLFNLNRLALRGHEVTFITTRFGTNAKLQTEKWLFRNGMNYPTVILSRAKAPLIAAMDLDFYVDDKWETILDVAGWDAGIEMCDPDTLNIIGPTKSKRFNHVYLVSAGWNASQPLIFGSVKVESVREALEREDLWINL